MQQSTSKNRIEKTKTNMTSRMHLTRDRYFKIIKPMIYQGVLIKDIAAFCKIDAGIISLEIRRFGDLKDIETVKKNVASNLIYIKRPPNKDNEKRTSMSRKRYLNIIKPLIYQGLTSVDITHQIGLKDHNRIRIDAKRFGGDKDYKILINNGVNKKREILLLTMENKTSKPEKMLFDIVKKTFPSAIHRYKILSDKNYFWELDVAVVDEKINFEYDGLYWHKNDKRDKHRDNFLIKNGWKVLRFKYLESPSYEVLLKDFNHQLDLFRLV